MNCRTYVNIFGTSLALAIGIAYGQTKVSTLSIAEPRPLAGAADALALKCGCQINYEDAEYIYAGDLADVTLQTVNPAYLKEHPEKRVLVPRPAPIQLQHAVDARTSDPDLAAVLQQLVGTHNNQGNPGQFRVQQSGKVFHIVPARMKDASGNWVDHASPLDQRISFPGQTMSGLNAVDLICQLISKTQGKEVIVATIPKNYLAQTTVTLSANNDVARDVLMRALTELKWRDPAISEPTRKLMWRLFYGPDTHQYGLNINVARVENVAPNGGTIIVNQ